MDTFMQGGAAPPSPQLPQASPAPPQAAPGGLDPTSLQMIIQALRSRDGNGQQQTPAELSSFSTPLGVAGNFAGALSKAWKDAHPDTYDEKGRRKDGGLLAGLFGGGKAGGSWDTTVTPEA